MSGKFSMDDYIDVAERIQDFKDAHPDGSLQTGMWGDGEWFKVAEIGGKHFIVYRAEAYRTPDDERPGHGIAWEPFPGTTSFTKNSELMNAETAAWGRAIVALGLTANRKLASRQEVRARVEEQEAEGNDESKPSSRGRTATRPNAQTPPAEGHSGAEDASGDASDGNGPVTTEQLENIARLTRQVGMKVPQWKALVKEVGADGKKSNELTSDQATWVIVALTKKAAANTADEATT